MWYSLNQLMAQGSEVIFYTPYIICGKEMYDDLQTLTEKGTRIDIITNDVNRGANPWGCTDYLNQKEKIWSTGVKVYEYMGAHSSRTKAVLIDDRMSIIGSYNLDMRSTYQDTELMLAVDSPTLNQMIQKEAEYDKTCSRIADENGNYTYGENYVPREMSTGKKIIYGILRVVTVPIRKFL
jgi:putative cardiolipin synthase